MEGGKAMSLSEGNREKLAKLEALEKKDEERDEADLAAQMSVRERLMRRLKSNTVKIPFQDDLGEFNVEARLLSPDEQKTIGDYRIQLLKFREELQKAPTDIKELIKLEKRGAELVQSIYELVADICIDKTLDFQYWKDGKGFNIDVPMRIINDVLIASQRTEADTAKFRPK
jgi:hypothetical protein